MKQPDQPTAVAALTPAAGAASRRILFVTMGSLGDLHPCIGLALELQRRGHHVTIATTEFYRSKVEELSLAFKPLRPDFNPTDGETIAKCQNIRRGPEVLIRELVLPHLNDNYADLLDAASNADLMLAGELLYAAPLVAEKLSLPWASIILSPCSFFSAHDPSLMVNVPALYRLRKAGPFVNRAMLHFGILATNHWWGPIRKLRRAEGLGRARNPLVTDKFSPHLVLALFSHGLATAQPDWPSSAAQPGFIFYDSARRASPHAEALLDFLAAGDPPIVFTQGSTAVHDAGSFYEVSAEAAKQIGRRAVLIGANPSQRFQRPDLFAVPYAPYSDVFPKASVIVHQGGSGTTGQAMRAGRPMLFVPYGWDQPDNAARIERTGAALSVSREHYTVEAATRLLNHLLSDSSFAQNAARLARQVAREDGTTTACDAIEEVLAREHRRL
ncbi:MAG: glycosyltransferase [Terracidiphilus sp.]